MDTGTYMELIFWISFLGVFYAYFGYPLLLFVLGEVKKSQSSPKQVKFEDQDLPFISLLIPAHNEESVIGAKIDNCLSLNYPGKFQILLVSDGSIDGTNDIIRQYADEGRLEFVEIAERKGKANALNKGLEHVEGDIVVFTDASIMLDENALYNIVQPFVDPAIGCVSGEDLIEEKGGEGLYGRYELFLRNQESKIASIVGASGSFYAQRKEVINPFQEGVAPDFLSVLETIEKGYRAISCNNAFGHMNAVKSHKDEFQRKVRTLIRGMTALFKKKAMLNPFKFSTFSLFLWSHKMMRWFVPFFLLAMVISNLFLLDSGFYELVFIAQCGFYLAAFFAYRGIGWVYNSLPGKVALYFTSVNVAILAAWFKYFSGIRQEVWTPSNRN